MTLMRMVFSRAVFGLHGLEFSEDAASAEGADQGVASKSAKSKMGSLQPHTHGENLVKFEAFLKSRKGMYAPSVIATCS